MDYLFVNWDARTHLACRTLEDALIAAVDRVEAGEKWTVWHTPDTGNRTAAGRPVEDGIGPRRP